MEINCSVRIKQVDKDSAEILGTVYYTEAYLTEMMHREYARGLHDGETIYRLEPLSENALDSNFNFIIARRMAN